MKDNLENLVRDLSVPLKGMAHAFGDRVQQISAQDQSGGNHERPHQDDLAAMCMELRRQRRLRSAYFPADLFHEPSWDMLLMLYLARVERRTMYVKTLVMAADAPITTSQRWIDHLARMGLVIRTEDPADRRRVEVQLSDSGADAMETYLIAMRTPEQG